MNTKRIYLERFLRMAIDLYHFGDGRDGSSEWIREQARLRGYAEAGRLIGLVNGEEIQQTIDSAHLKVFGETRHQRRDRLGEPRGLDHREVDWDKLDTPAYERRR